MFPYGFWDNDLWKEAARAGLRQISKMVGQGNLAGASALAKAPGVLKPSLAGSQIKHLGRGGEGLATMVAHPEHGVAVRKLYDPRGISGPEMIARKEQAGTALAGNQNFAQFLGAAQTPHGGQMHFNEYIQPGRSPAQRSVREQSVANVQRQATADLANAGFSDSRDVRRGNMVYDANAGQHRVIDYLPARSGELHEAVPGAANVVVPLDKDKSPFNRDYDPAASDETGGMLGRLLGGKTTPGGTRGGSMTGQDQTRNGFAPAAAPAQTAATELDPGAAQAPGGKVRFVRRAPPATPGQIDAANVTNLPAYQRQGAMRTAVHTQPPARSFAPASSPVSAAPATALGKRPPVSASPATALQRPRRLAA